MTDYPNTKKSLEKLSVLMKQNQQFVQFKKDILGYFDGTNKNTEISLIFNSDNTE